MRRARPAGIRTRPPRRRRGRRPLRHLHRADQRPGRRGACPVRYRCAGCDHFRTNVAFLPDLQAHLDDLLRTRERLAATIDGVDDWARADATPTQEEITRIRRLINRIKGDIADLDDTEQARIADAVAVVRGHRAAHTVPLGMPSLAAIPPAPPTIASEATA